jgi:hypothetical protein
MDPVRSKGRSGDPTERGKPMKKEKHEKTTVTVILTDEEDQVLSRLCILKKPAKLDTLLVSLRSKPSRSFSVTPPRNTWEEGRP